jgi:Overcoming lysogenization defect protein-like, TOPRIM domain
MRFGADDSARAVILVEGVSDRRAVEALAARRGRDFRVEGVSVVSLDGVTNIGPALEAFGLSGRDLQIAGLYDAGEEADVGRAMERAGLGTDLARAEIEALGFYVCDPDLEGELIRSLGHEIVERVLEQHGELDSFRTFQKQPEWRDRPVAYQLRRFMGSGSGRKIRLAPALVDALDLGRVPRPLDGVLSAV